MMTFDINEILKLGRNDQCWCVCVHVFWLTVNGANE